MDGSRCGAQDGGVLLGGVGTLQNNREYAAALVLLFQLTLPTCWSDWRTAGEMGSNCVRWRERMSYKMEYDTVSVVLRVTMTNLRAAGRVDIGWNFSRRGQQYGPIHAESLLSKNDTVLCLLRGPDTFCGRCRGSWVIFSLRYVECDVTWRGRV